jgi:hypothetical protein
MSRSNASGPPSCNQSWPSSRTTSQRSFAPFCIKPILRAPPVGGESFVIAARRGVHTSSRGGPRRSSEELTHLSGGPEGRGAVARPRANAARPGLWDSGAPTMRLLARLWPAWRGVSRSSARSAAFAHPPPRPPFGGDSCGADRPRSNIVRRAAGDAFAARAGRKRNKPRRSSARPLAAYRVRTPGKSARSWLWLGDGTVKLRC